MGVGVLKSITYVSKVISRQNGAVIPTGLSQIFRAARRKNSEHDITGVLSYRKGHYIQVLEGNESAIDQLYSNITQDSRHEKVTKILDFNISKRSFPSWNMKLLESISKDRSFVSMIEQHKECLADLEPDQQRLLELFCDYKNTRMKVVQSYEGKDLKLSAWPDFTSLEPTPTVIELCARLTAGPHSYDLLLESREFGTKQQFDLVLEQFASLEILVLSDSGKVSAEKDVTNRTGSFYYKMKDFLRLN